LSAGTAGLVNSVVVISLPDFAAIWGSAQNASFLFVTVTPGTSANDVATRIEAAVDGVTVQTRGAFAAEERALIRDMGTSIILVMNLLGFLIGLAIMALTVYLAMLARRAEFGMLKAVGASNRALYRVVMLQALASVVVGVIVAIMVTLALSVLLPRLGSNVTLAVGGTSLVKALVASLIIAGLAAGLPIKRIAGLDPAAVFRGG
jgi:putative ABC transport system permease protein